ncbi:hypothetical protein [Fodinicola feengrottensis]|uniref:hypothetical protein n=1 Tax=Fodinicola feengrottensis TaxID=435914 RepID=UPI0013D8208E
MRSLARCRSPASRLRPARKKTGESPTVGRAGDRRGCGPAFQQRVDGRVEVAVFESEPGEALVVRGDREPFVAGAFGVDPHPFQQLGLFGDGRERDLHQHVQGPGREHPFAEFLHLVEQPSQQLATVLRGDRPVTERRSLLHLGGELDSAKVELLGQYKRPVGPLDGRIGQVPEGQGLRQHRHRLRAVGSGQLVEQGFDVVVGEAFHVGEVVGLPRQPHE